MARPPPSDPPLPLPSDPLGPVRTVHVTQSSSSSVTIAWNKVPGATGYRVSWRSGHGGHQGFGRVMGGRSGWNTGCFFGVQAGHGARAWPALQLPPSSLPGPEKSRLVPGEAAAAELDRLEPDTEYTVRVWASVDGVEGPPTSVVVRTGEWPRGSRQPPLIGYAALLRVPGCSTCRSITAQCFSPHADPPHADSGPAHGTLLAAAHRPPRGTDLLPLRVSYTDLSTLTSLGPSDLSALATPAPPTCSPPAIQGPLTPHPASAPRP